jgi:hypothetical protein
LSALGESLPPAWSLEMSPKPKTDPRAAEKQWLTRLDAVAKAQEKYIWAIVLAAVFFWALQSSVIAGEGESELIEAPIFEIKLAASVVWAAGPAVLSFLVLALYGSLRAVAAALDKLGHPNEVPEAFDVAPNALDFAVYRTPHSHPLWSLFSHFAYPIFVTLVLLETLIILEMLLLYLEIPVAGRWVFVILGAFLWALAVTQCRRQWYSRIDRAKKRLHVKNEEAPFT